MIAVANRTADAKQVLSDQRISLLSQRKSSDKFCCLQSKLLPNEIISYHFVVHGFVLLRVEVHISIPAP